MTTTTIAVVGGVYREQCIWPDWDHVYGSAGRAAVALVGHVDEITLHAYLSPELESKFGFAAKHYGITLDSTSVSEGISFSYVHCMSTPVISPPVSRIQSHLPIAVQADVVLRFGMLEGSGKVNAKWCVYDPQSAFGPELFGTNESSAEHLAIVANRGEVLAMTGETDPKVAANKLLARGAEVVVVKSGPAGAYVYTADGDVGHVPAYQSKGVWTIGSGDVFAAIFTARWAVHGDTPSQAAQVASRAVSLYAETMSLPSPSAETLLAAQSKPASTVNGRVYLASPFFTIGQRWLVDEIRRCLTELGLEVLSPVHDIGPGPASVVGPADLEALDDCDRVFAIVDGLDAGTIFEVGYARAKGKPVYVLAQAVGEEDLKMVEGSGSHIFFDFVTALHYTAWKV
ncbi:PfkB family carbohydrate kinase [Pandoraea apista]|uniref:PfkB family carbohydrate kinase n=1 Tax=Pandoraea apista TaxID=93218 RepID=UPI00058AB723|nr:PfkB family carbohydrate kinase [Pandoraea apista]AJE98829.1 nucleoside 2-deoxyribosyltransferase [Pandoraea apista]AKH72909.1 nucleoside 2-deoxyribosyltransferase [Pandoraea apista]AKI61294.1 nucleoside 2-deoxyribosyltransferase [Pandoraea apista]